MSKLVKQVSDDDFTAVVLEAQRPVVVDFWAAWCPPCRVLDRVVAEIAKERPDILFAKLDVDSDQHTAARYGVLSMPTLIAFVGGEELLRLVGSRPKRRLEAELEQVFGARALAGWGA